MAILMCMTWLVLFVLTIVAFYKGLIFNSKEEDVIKDILPQGLQRLDSIEIDEKQSAV